MSGNYRLPIETSQLILIQNLMSFSALHHPIIVQRQYTFLPYHPHTANQLVPRGRVELPLSYENRILSPARLPVPPSGRTTLQSDLLSTKP